MFKRGVQKFIAYYQAQGFFYAFYRGVKYAAFLLRQNNPFLTQPRAGDCSIGIGRLKLIYKAGGGRLKLYWEDIELTRDVGLNIALATVGGWTDSSLGEWFIQEADDCSMVIKNNLSYLPLSLIWRLRVITETRISVEVEFEAEEDIVIDRKRLVLALDPHYSSWFGQGLQAASFFGLVGDGVLVHAGKGNGFNRWLGVLPSVHGESWYPGLILKITQTTQEAVPLIQRFKISDVFVHLIGLEIGSETGVQYYSAGRQVLCLEIDVLERDIFKSYISRLEGAPQPAEQFSKQKKTPKVLLVNLPWRRSGRWGVRAGSRWPHIKDDAEEGHYLPFPFFLAYAANLLRIHGVHAVLVDALAEKITEAGLSEIIHKASPDLLVAETSTPSLNHDLALLKRIGNRDFKICLCGPDFNLSNPEFLERHKFIDFCLVGEYEEALLGLVKNLFGGQGLKSVKGLLCRQGGKIVSIPPGELLDLDTLPWPLRQEKLMSSYIDTPGAIPAPSVQMLASRGCPFGCHFCLWPQLMYCGRNYRSRNIADCLDEMEYLIRKMKFRSVYFDDDTFNVGRERMLVFCQEIKRRGLETTPWAIMARADLMDEEILTRMKEAGLTAVKYGVESASQELLNNCGKEMDLKKTEKMILFTQSLGIKTHLTFTFGLPGETQETIEKTIDYALKLKPFSVQFSITTPFPGTRYFDELSRRGFIVNKNWDNYDGNFKSVIKLDALSAADLEAARRRACLLWDDSNKLKRDRTSSIVKLSESYWQGGMRFAFRKIIRYFKQNRPNYFINKIRDNYLDVLGVLHGTYAFKGPHTIQIDLTDHCNNNCLACWCNSPLLSRQRLDKPKSQLPAPLVNKLISQAAGMGLREIYFSGGGEPFMHPDILDIIGRAKKLGMACSVNTNFTLLNEKIIQRLIDLRLNHLTVSVWAGSADTYCALHPNKGPEDFRRIYELLRLLNTTKVVYPSVKIYNVISNVNYLEIGGMLDFALKTRSEFVEFTVVDTIPGATDKIILNRQQANAVLEQFHGISQELIDSQNNHRLIILNLEHFLRRLSSLGASAAQYDADFIETMPCYVGWVFARIMPDGDVNSCLKSHRFPVGNIYRHSFKKIWNSQKQRYFRKKTLRFDTNDPFFGLIGNDPDCKLGCYKSCDDLNRNIAMHRKISALDCTERRLLKILAKLKMGWMLAARDKR